MLKKRRSHDRLFFNIGIPIYGKDGLYIETGPRLLCVHVVSTTVQLHAQNLPSYSELLTREEKNNAKYEK